MSMITSSKKEAILSKFEAGDINGIAELLEDSPEMLDHNSLTAHPLIREFVNRNNGHCYKKNHLRIADILTPEIVRSFRDAIIDDRFDDVESHLQSTPNLIHSEFTAGRGISQPIHHWKSLAIGRLLVNSGSNLQALTSRGESPLTMQLRFGTLLGVEFLLKEGIDPNHGTGGHLPTRSMEKLIKLLLSYGWNINNGQMLHDANHGHCSRVKMWLKYGADPNSKNRFGQTALHLFAARGTGRECIKILIKMGAEINSKDNKGNSPLDLARQAPQQIAAKTLVQINEIEKNA